MDRFLAIEGHMLIREKLFHINVFGTSQTLFHNYDLLHFFQMESFDSQQKEYASSTPGVSAA